jgi:rod shape-determining protein MreD
MSQANTLFLFGIAFLAIFLEAAFDGFRHLADVQLDLLPSLIVYASLSGGMVTLSLLAFFGGLLFDSLSVNPLGVSVLPLFVVGMAIYSSRDLILRSQRVAQVVLGTGASAAVPLLTLVILLTTGHKPLLGWETLWQLTAMSLAGALATPACFWLFALLERTLIHSRAPETSFRADREIRRGRN